MALPLPRLKKLFRIFRVRLWTRALLSFRVAASVEHEALLRLIGPLDYIVDIGANRGQFALLSRHLFPGAKIVSFEPLRSAADVFVNVFRGDQFVHLFPSAVGPRQCSAKMHISARLDSSSLLPIGDLQVKTFPGTYEVDSSVVEVAPLDFYLSDADILNRSLLKIDVQGYEYEVLQGSESLLKSFSWILCECSFVELYSGQHLFPEVIKLLALNRFSIYSIVNPFYNPEGALIQCDVLFRRES